MEISVGVSNRHVHLDRDTCIKLFNTDELKVVRNLSQGGEFVSDKVVIIKGVKGEIANVKVIGPLREKTQVEVSLSDAYKLGINPPVRMSNNFEGAEDITLSNGDVDILVKNSCIIANRHIHCKTSELSKYGLSDGQVLSVRVNGIRGGVMNNVIVKAKETYNLEMHIDKDEANAFMLSNGSIVEIMEESWKREN